MAENLGERYLELAGMAEDRGIELGDFPGDLWAAVYFGARALGLPPELATDPKIPMPELREFARELSEHRKRRAGPERKCGEKKN
jgi:hypothetical protein